MMFRLFFLVGLFSLLSPILAAPRVALILPGSDTDKGWNQMAREGLEQIRKELGAQVKAVTNVKSSDFYNQIANFAEDGYDIILCHGGEFEKAVVQGVKNYPKVRFVVAGCSSTIKGATTIEFLTRDTSRLVGLVAGKVSRTQKAAFVGAMKVGPLEACYDGMIAGLKDAGGNTQALPAIWTNSWDSPILAREAAENAINAGADVIYQNVDAAAGGVFQAASTANKPDRPIYAFGCNANQNAMAPDVILGSVVLGVPKAYLDTVKEIAAGQHKSGALKLGLKEGYVDLVLNDKHPAITDEIRKAVANGRATLTQK